MIVTPIQIEVDGAVAPDETRQALRWFVEKQFEAPGFDWCALSIEVHGGEPGSGFGSGGFFYNANGRWRAARFDGARDRDEGYRVFDEWMRAAKHGFGRAWRSALVQIFRRGGVYRAQIDYDFARVDRWTSAQVETLQGDFLRPASLPIPIVDGVLRLWCLRQPRSCLIHGAWDRSNLRSGGLRNEGPTRV